MKICNKDILFWYISRNGKAFWENDIWRKVKHLIRELFFTKYNYSREGEGDCCFYISSTRKDLLEHFFSIYKCCEEPKSMIISGAKYKFSFYGIYSFLKYSYLFREYKSVLVKEYDVNGSICNEKEIRIPFWGRLYFIAYFSNVTNLLTTISSKEMINAKNLVVLNDCMSGESLLVNYCKKRKITTICCQEGFYYDDPNNEKDIQTKYLDISADYHFVWGDYTKLLFEKYNSKCIPIICGEPYVKKRENEPISKKWCIICDVPILHDNNQTLINIVSNLAKLKGIMVDIRLHPQERNVTEPYEINEKICSYSIQEIRYAAYFAHTSSLSYQLMAQGIPVFIFYTEYSKKLPTIGLPVFENEGSLMEMLNDDKNYTFTDNMNYYLKYIDSDAEEMYRLAFKSIMNL